MRRNINIFCCFIPLNLRRDSVPVRRSACQPRQFCCYDIVMTVVIFEGVVARLGHDNGDVADDQGDMIAAAAAIMIRAVCYM